MESEKEHIWTPYLRGIGQIMLQNNALTGLLFLIGIFVNSPLMALAAAIAAVVGTLTAKLLKYAASNIANGLYGFNATLVGIAMVVFFPATSWLTWVLVVVLSGISTVAMNFALVKKVPVFTFPFIAITWLAMALVPAPELPETIVLELYDLLPDGVEQQFSILNHGFGFGEVIFQSNLLSGVIFFAAVFISTPRSALYGMFGAVLGVVIALLLKDRMTDVQAGMFSFNALLCAIVFGGERKTDMLYVILAVLLSGFLEETMLRLELPVLTFPFVAATWLTLIVKSRFEKKKVQTA